MGSLKDRVGVGVESCKIVFLRGHLLFTCSDTAAKVTFAVDVSLSHNTQRHRETDGQTDNQTTV